MPDRSRFFVVPFDPEKPVEEVSNAGIARNRLKEKEKPLAVGVEYLATGYKELMRKEPMAQAVEVLMRRLLRAAPEMILTTREIAAQGPKQEEAEKEEGEPDQPLGPGPGALRGLPQE